VVTLVIAIIGAATGVASLAWNVISWKRQGPLIRVQATCSGRGPAMKITGIVRNKGRFDATLESAWFRWLAAPQGTGAGASPGRPIQVAIPAANIADMTLSSPLPAESGTEFTITGIGQIDLGLEVALHDRRQVAIMITTASGRQTKKVIRYA
jgi:hypothetical protein